VNYVWHKRQRAHRRVYQLRGLHDSTNKLLGTITVLGRKQYDVTREIFGTALYLTQLTNLADAKAYLLAVVRILK